MSFINNLKMRYTNKLQELKDNAPKLSDYPVGTYWKLVDLYEYLIKLAERIEDELRKQSKDS